MEVLLLIVMGVVNILCFIIGARVGQTVSKGREVEMPSINPFKAVEEHRAKKEAEKNNARLATIMANIDNYDGTGYGQEDVPRG